MEEKRLENFNSVFERFLQKNRGKVILLFGNPFTGKSTFAVNLCKSAKSYIYYAIDTTIPAEGIQLTRVRNWNDLRYKLRNLQEVPELIVIDSLTTLASEFNPENLISPRANLMLARFYDEVLRTLSKFRNKATILVIAHEALDFMREKPEPQPRMNKNSLRNVDVIYRAIKENGKYRIVKWAERKAVEKPEFDVEL